MDTLKRIEQMLDLPDADKARVVTELAAHYEEIRQELVDSGMEPAKAQEEAERRLGDPQAIASNMNAVHCVAPWRSALIAAAPFLVSGIAIARSSAHGVWAQVMLGLIVLSGVVIVAGTVRGFLRGGRPIWLPVWTAAAVAAVYAGISGASIELHIRGVAGVSYLVLLYLPPVLPAIVAICLCWRVRRWRMAAILIAVCGVLLSCLVAALIVMLAGPEWMTVATAVWFQLFATALWVLIALRVFAVHEYGSAAQAALFIVASRLIPTFGTARPLFTAWSGIDYAILGTITVLAFARASAFSRKIAILGTALLAAGILSTIAANHAPAQQATIEIAWHWLSLLIGLGALYAAVYFHRVQRAIAT